MVEQKMIIWWVKTHQILDPQWSSVSQDRLLNPQWPSDEIKKMVIIWEVKTLLNPQWPSDEIKKMVFDSVESAVVSRQSVKMDYWREKANAHVRHQKRVAFLAFRERVYKWLVVRRWVEIMEIDVGMLYWWSKREELDLWRWFSPQDLRFVFVSLPSRLVDFLSLVWDEKWSNSVPFHSSSWWTMHLPDFSPCSANDWYCLHSHSNTCCHWPNYRWSYWPWPNREAIASSPPREYPDSLSSEHFPCSIRHRESDWCLIESWDRRIVPSNRPVHFVIADSLLADHVAPVEILLEAISVPSSSQRRHRLPIAPVDWTGRHSTSPAFLSSKAHY